MRSKWPVFAAFAILGAGYFSYPYVTLWRLDLALRQADAATLGSLVDWYAVREGLKEDICDMAADEPGEARSGKELAPFGAGFARGITTNVVDRTVTAETLASLNDGTAHAPRAGARVVWAFFSDPTRFAIDVRTGGTVEPIHMVMELRGVRWQVRRVWLPTELLGRAGSGT